MPRNYVQAQDFTLNGSGIGIADTTIPLSSFTLPNSNEAITMAMFGDIGYGTLEPETPREENISFTGITQNANGTAVLTGVTRGLDLVDPYTVDLALRQSHAGATIFRITNSVQLYAMFANKYNDENIEGKWIFLEAERPELTADIDATQPEELVTLGELARATFSGAVPASTTVPGISMEATQADYDAKTASRLFSGNPYRLFINPSTNRATKYNDGVADTGAADAYVITPSPAITAYSAYQQFTFIANNTNTGPSTLSVNGLAAIDIKKNTTEDLEAGDIVANGVYIVIYDGTDFQLQGQQGSTTNLITDATRYTANTQEDQADYFTTIMSLPYEGGAGQIDAGWTIASNNPNNQIKTGFGVTYSSFNSGGGYLPNIGFGSSGAGLSLDWANTKIYRIKFVAACASQGAGDDMGLGFVDSAQVATFSDATSVQRAIKLVFTGTTDLAFVTGDGTSNQTQTTSSISIDDLNLYEIIWIPGVSAQLYVNGTLLFTNSTVLPSSGGSTPAFGFGNNSLSGVLVISNPSISIEL